MSRLDVINNKLDKIIKNIGNDNIDHIIIWNTEDEPYRFDLIYKNSNKGIKSIYCDTYDEYLELKEKYKDIRKLEFIGVKKPKADEIKEI